MKEYSDKELEYYSKMDVRIVLTTEDGGCQCL